MTIGQSWWGQSVPDAFWSERDLKSAQWSRAYHRTTSCMLFLQQESGWSTWQEGQLAANHPLYSGGTSPQECSSQTLDSGPERKRSSKKTRAFMFRVIFASKTQSAELSGLWLWLAQICCQRLLCTLLTLFGWITARYNLNFMIACAYSDPYSGVWSCQ